MDVMSLMSCVTSNFPPAIVSIGLPEERGETHLAISSSALGVDHPLGDALAVEVGELVDQVEVLEQQRAHRPNALEVMGVGHGGSIRGGVRGLLIVPEGRSSGILGAHSGGLE